MQIIQSPSRKSQYNQQIIKKKWCERLTLLPDRSTQKIQWNSSIPVIVKCNKTHIIFLIPPNREYTTRTSTGKIKNRKEDVMIWIKTKLYSFVVQDTELDSNCTWKNQMISNRRKHRTLLWPSHVESLLK